MTTGATGFTRAAGLAGLLSVVLVVGGIATMFSDDPFDRGSQVLMLAAFILALVCGVIFSIGLIARHRGLWWVPVAVSLLVPSTTIWILSLGVGRENPISTVAAWVMGLTLTGVMLGVFLAGELPRRATFLMLVAGAFDREDGPAYLVLFTAVIGMIGFVSLAWAMSREPLAEGEPYESVTHGSPVPA